MFTIQTYLQLPYTNIYEAKNPKAKYVHIEDAFRLQEVFGHPKFTPDHMQMLITIQYNGQTIVGFDTPSAPDSWGDYLVVIEQFLRDREAQTAYGFDSMFIKMKSVNIDFLEFMIRGEWDTSAIFAQATLPTKDFLQALLNTVESFWRVLYAYKVFEEKLMRSTTPKDLPLKMLRKIEQMQSTVMTMTDYNRELYI